MIESSKAWKHLEQLARERHATSVASLFARDAQRFERYSFACADLLVDLSKQALDEQLLPALLALAREARLEARIHELFSGGEVNFTEHRAALHTALRQMSDTPVVCGGRDVIVQVRAAQAQMKMLSERLRSGQWLGASGRPLRKIINIGIGGSDLGPRLACDALQPYGNGVIECRFVANIDTRELASALSGVDPAEALIIVTSKTFGTQETLVNARSARAWLARSLGDGPQLEAHFLAVTANVEAARRFGIPDAQTLPMWDWVGGRYSVWSPVGFALAALVGWENFMAFLGGANDVDEHFRTTPLASNVPVLLGLTGIWNRNFGGRPDLAVVPYAQGLQHLPAYLQQAEMESNGKLVRRDGSIAPYATCPAILGGVGTTSQHAYFQWLHQGAPSAVVDFVVVASGADELPGHQEILLANALAQSQALLVGKTSERAEEEMRRSGMDTDEAKKLAPHRSFAGNRASSTIVLPRLDPRGLGQLLALYEHKIYVQGVVWGINSFDQWGVELGKTLAGPLLQAFEGAAEPAALDGSTRGLLRRLRALRTRG